MAIKITGVGGTLPITPNTAFYTAPIGVQSATIATGTAENRTSAPALLYMRIAGGRTSWIIDGKDVMRIGSPMVLPPVTLMPGERLECWCSAANAIDMNLTIGVQQ